MGRPKPATLTRGGAIRVGATDVTRSRPAADAVVRPTPASGTMTNPAEWVVRPAKRRRCRSEAEAWGCGWEPPPRAERGENQGDHRESNPDLQSHILLCTTRTPWTPCPRQGSNLGPPPCEGGARSG